MWIAGALLALSTIGGAAGLLWASNGGEDYVRLGLAGALAVGLFWAGRGQTPVRAAARGTLISALLLAGAVTVFLSSLMLLDGRHPLEWLGIGRPEPSAVGKQFGVEDEFRVQSWVVIPELTALSWLLDFCALVLAVAIGPMIRRRLTGAPPVRGDHRYMPALPFVLLAFAALIDGALVAAGVSVLSGLWLLVAVRAAASPGLRPSGA